MKKRISAIVKELGIASVGEIASILVGLSGELKKKTLSLKLEEMEKEGIVFKILQTENSRGIEGYIAGPNVDVKDNFEVKTLVVGRGLSSRDLQDIDWESFSFRHLDALLEDVKNLQKDLEENYDEPRNIEMRYFDVSIKYHELYGFFFDNYNTDFLISVRPLLKDCRDQIDKRVLDREPSISTGT